MRPGVCAERLTGANSCGQPAYIKLRISNRAHQSARIKTARADASHFVKQGLKRFLGRKNLSANRAVQKTMRLRISCARPQKKSEAQVFLQRFKAVWLRCFRQEIVGKRRCLSRIISFLQNYKITKLRNREIAESDFLIELGYNKVSSKNAAKQFCAFDFFASAERGFWNFSPRDLRLPKFKNAVVFSDSILNPRNCKVAKIAGLNAPT